MSSLVASRATRREWIGLAVAVAGQLPAQLGAELLDTARAAYAWSFELTAAISAAVTVATAILAVVLLRRARAGPGSDGACGP